MVGVERERARLHAACERLRSRGERIGFVPTMGALHEGHLSLVRAVREAGATQVVMSIFVNPKQFGPNEDLARYPRTLQDDLAACERLGVELVYAPDAEAMYPRAFQTYVDVEGLSRELEGRHRPGHFRGVTTVVCKLLHAVGPCTAAFGHKDYQQWRVLERMTRDLDMPVQVLGCPTVREADGLALSSRNRYLDASERRRALAIYRALRRVRDAFGAGERGARRLQAHLHDELEPALDRIDYAVVADADDLTVFDERAPDRAVALVAGYVGTTRLIDNMLLTGTRTGTG